jgi:hypothetical protein
LVDFFVVFLLQLQSVTENGTRLKQKIPFGCLIQKSQTTGDQSKFLLEACTIFSTARCIF